MIRLEHLNKYFNKGRQNEIHVINDISLELPEKGMVAIFGKSGCGKTTLLNVIGGLDRFSGGSLTVDGQSIRQDTDALRNREIGYIFQNYNLNKSESCYDNVADALRLCGMKDGWQMRERVDAALRNVGMEQYVARTPDTLSGGQQQRIAIARAIVKNPRIILADEPTGNLDEANTILVMDLLKEISRDHLVLLVTHEADLVDYYCDTVIELQDGCVRDIRQNAGADGLRAKDKNDIFLGELEKRTGQVEGNVAVEYYGEPPAEPIRLRVVNSGGKLYLRIDTPRVQVLDDTSEVKLREGVFGEKHGKPRDGERIDMSKLPPVEGTHYGRLYTFRSALKSGWRTNFSGRRRGKKFLFVLMTMFSAVLVLMTSLFGTAFRDIFQARDANSRNTFYVYTPEDGSVSDRLLAALGDPASGIDGLSLTLNRTGGDRTLRFNAGFFETFGGGSYGNSISVSSHGVVLDRKLAEDFQLLAGRNTALEGAEMLISSALADDLLKNSTIGYLDDYESLIGLTSAELTAQNWEGEAALTQSLRVAGVVRSAEMAVYVDSLALARLAIGNSGLSVTSPATVRYTGEIPTGSTVLYVNADASSGKKLPAVGDKVQIHGLTLTVREIVKYSYDEQIEEMGKEFWYTEVFLVNAEDYVAISRRYGETDPLALPYSYYYEDDVIYEDVIIEEKAAISSDMEVSVASGQRYYTVVHSSDPDATAAWMQANFGTLTSPDGFSDPLITPDELYREEIEDSMSTIVSSIITMAVVMGILCICIYFIMRSSLLKGIREVGIYRAIGVTKKNLVYRFFIESAVLTVMTTLIGFLLTSTLMRLWLHATPLMEQIFYYPLWLAGFLLVLITGVCLLCGILPVLTLLNKTPSEILAKYDI